ncbi:permease [Ahrensia sp. R2A130]|uniref:permease n=1 Tax=Ahrensia sp. R2A130 TaxID=744979 RepID=UPI0001E0A419|nr:permease [Ahrensia sp. R2A130]EFL90061.1 permease [Ahrensia sp. R2A130]
MNTHQYLRSLVSRTATTFLKLVKIMLPVMIFVRIADQLGFSKWLGDVLAPVMCLVGLPGEAGLVWAIALLTGFYGGVGGLVALVATVELTALQLNILLSMIMFAHALPVEQSIVRAAGVSAVATGLVRIATAITFGFLLWHIGSATEVLTEPAQLGFLPEVQTDTGWLAWTISTIRTLGFMLLILFVLLALLDCIRRIGLFDRLTALLTPFFRMIGIVPALAPLVTIGMLLGLSYGGGLIVEETKKRQYSRRELFTPLAGLSIIHAVLEDTFVAIALGANIWIILVWHTLYAFAVIALIGGIIQLWPRKTIAPKRHSL